MRTDEGFLSCGAECRHECFHRVPTMQHLHALAYTPWTDRPSQAVLPS